MTQPNSALSYLSPLPSSGFSGQFGANFFSPTSQAFKNGAAKSAGGAMFEPLTGGLFALNAGLSFIGGERQRQAMENASNAQIEASLAMASRNEGFQRDQMAANAGVQLANMNAAYGWGAGQQLAREKDAALFRTGPLAEREMNLRNRERIFNQDLANSMSAREFEQRQNKLAMERSLANRIGTMTAMFGKTQPINVDYMFG